MRMYLKNNKKRFHKKRLLLITLIIIILIYIYSILYKNLYNYYLNYSENEASKIITNVIYKSINEESLKELKNNELYKITKNKDKEIEMIDYNPYLINSFLRKTIEDLIKNLEKEESKKDNVSFYIPFGSIFQNPILNNRGPKIPVRMELVGSIITSIDSKIKDYGINNSLIEVYMHIEIKERLILPTKAKEAIIINDIPISYRIIKGKVPSYYSNNGFSYMMPIE